MSEEPATQPAPETPPVSSNLAPASGDVTIDVVLPSGLAGCMRRWKLGDLRFLGDRQKLSKPGPVVNATILRSTWINTHDTGPYAFTGTPPWMTDILVGDTLDAVRRGRMLFWGNDYHVDFPCERINCGARLPHDQDLSKLPVVPLSEEALATFTHDDRFEFRLPDCGRMVTHRLSTGNTQTHAEKLAKQHGVCDEVVWAARTRTIEGVSSPGLFTKFYGGLSADDVAAMDEEMKRHDCGLETTVEDLACPECGLRQSRELRFGGFFYRHQRGQRDFLG